MLLILFASLLFCGNFDISVGQCDLCGVGNIACLTKNTFQMCIQGTPKPEIGNFTCPDDKVCVSSSPTRCLPATSTASCGANCGTCQQASSASCVDQKNFVYCIDNLQTAIGAACPEDLICNSASVDLCVVKTHADGPTCPTPPIDEQPPSIEPPVQPTNPMDFCRIEYEKPNVRFPRKFPAPGNCNRYNYCVRINSKTEGYQYPCPGNQQFNCQTQSCGGTCVPC